MIFLRSEMMKSVPFHCARHHTLKTTNRCAHRPRAEWPVARFLKTSAPLGMTKGKLPGSSGGFFLKFANDGQEDWAQRTAQFHRLRPALLQADAACIGQVCGLAAQSVAVLPTGMDGVANTLFGKMIQCAKAGADFLSVGFQFSIRVAHHFQAPLIMVVLPDQSR